MELPVVEPFEIVKEEQPLSQTCLFVPLRQKHIQRGQCERAVLVKGGLRVTRSFRDGVALSRRVAH